MKVSDRESIAQSLSFYFVTHQSSDTTRLKFLHPFTVSIDDVDAEITYLQDILSSLPRSNRRRASLLEALARALGVRYTKSDDEQYLEMSILQSTHAILLPSPLSRNIMSTFFFLTEALVCRALKSSLESKLPRDATCCLKYLYYMRNPSFERLGIIQNKVTKSLGLILALQMVLEPGNSLQYLEETAVLLREQLSSKLFGPELNDAVEAFSIAFDTYFADFLSPPSQQIIECLYEQMRAYRIQATFPSRCPTLFSFASF